RALAQADGGVERRIERERPGVHALERCVGDAGVVGQVDERLADVDAVHRDPPLRQRVGMAAGTAPDVEDAHARLEPQRVDEEPDLLLGALGERVAQVRRPRVRGDVLEPVVAYFAVAHESPKLRLTSSGTDRSAASAMTVRTSAAMSS